MTDGFEVTQQWLVESYDKFNKEYFNNELPSSDKIQLSVELFKDNNVEAVQFFDVKYYLLSTELKPFRFGDDRNKIYFNDVTEMKPAICINAKFDFTELQAEDTLIHEMIHLWNCVDFDKGFPKIAHGYDFKKKAKEINSKSGKYNIGTYDNLDIQLKPQYKKAHDKEKDYKYNIDGGSIILLKLFKLLKSGKKSNTFLYRWVYAHNKYIKDIITEIVKYHKDNIEECKVSQSAIDVLSKESWWKGIGKPVVEFRYYTSFPTTVEKAVTEASDCKDYTDYLDNVSESLIRPKSKRPKKLSNGVIEIDAGVTINTVNLKDL